MEVTAPSVDEAVSIGLIRLGGVGHRHVKVEVLEDPAEPGSAAGSATAGRQARVRLTLTMEKGLAAQRFLSRVALLYGCRETSVLVVREPERIVLQLKGRDAGELIGFHGQTLDALQLLTNTVATRASGDRTPLVIDAVQYRERRTGNLRRVAQRAAEEAVRTGRRVELPPMPAAERRVVHLALEGDGRVRTHSEGEEPHRFVVVEPVEEAAAAARSDSPGKSGGGRRSRRRHHAGGDAARRGAATGS
ncbi:MAG: RNA-binding cell elongation regulator Jag/EloR [Bacillota bacterium]|nr:RNA-binding cell elongation regulator Jag/EloR [Bacillota bacterium]